MKKITFLFVVAGMAWACLFLTSVSCTKTPSLFDDDPAVWETVQADFAAKRQLIAQDRFFSVFSADMREDERQALMFLYAYMPVGDIVDHPGSFFLENVRAAIRARNEMPWGKTVPDKEFRHFVLPLRVNNENLDSSRNVFYAELKDRVKGLSLYDAVLEVNHWCHEKAVYQPTDARTSSPLATVRTAYGRCGEESTLLVAALRSVCIPARQVYTPRWAHTDDNHAWVEAYVDGKWYFLGACEPEPVLNLAWFNEPASRGMLMHTKVFGRYPGPEEIMLEAPCYTEINVIGNYAGTAPVRVRVRDLSGKALPGMTVEFKLYNYAEFFTVARKQTDSTGTVRLTAGLGDMLVWASDGNVFGFSKVTFGKDSAVDLVLDHKKGEPFSVEFDVVPPKGKKSDLAVSREQVEANKKRLIREDSIRQAYVDGFYTPGKAKIRARSLGMDTVSLPEILVESRGNHAVLDAFLENVEPGKRAFALDFLSVLSPKDWRDVTLAVLENHFYGTLPVSDAYEKDFYVRYVLNPRVGYEMLSPYKECFRSVFPSTFQDSVRMDPAVLVRWIGENLRVDDAVNPLAAPISPEGVYAARIADSRSRDIFFVSVLRDFGIAARRNPVTGKVQYALRTGIWQDVDFAEAVSVSAAKGALQLRYVPVRALPNPRYYTHFSLSRFDKDGFSLQTYPEDGTSHWIGLFSRFRPMDTGYYLMVSGTRLAGGEVLARMSFFPVSEGEKTAVELVMRDDPELIKVVGSFNSESLYYDVQAGEIRSVLKTTGRGYFLIAVLGAGQEPTQHALRDLVAHKAELEKWGRPVLLLFPDEASYGKYLADPVPGLPSTVRFGVDALHSIRPRMEEDLRLRKDILPIFVLGDTFNRVVFVSQGYDINLGSRLMKTVRGL